MLPVNGISVTLLSTLAQPASVELSADVFTHQRACLRLASRGQLRPALPR